MDTYDANPPITMEFMGSSLTFDGKIKDLLFQSTIHHFSPNNNGKYKYDSVQTYVLNSHGYRSPEFKKGTKLVFGGCSYTYGVGIPEESIWGVQLANKLGVDYANISMPGAPVQWIVDQVFAYCREFGNPEYLVLAFPNFFRGAYVQNEGITAHEGYRPGQGLIRDVVFYNLLQVDVNKYPKVSRRPHDINEVTAPELPVYESMRSIRILEQFCEAAGIKLLWAFIEGSSEQSTREIEEQYGLNNRIDLRRDEWVNHYKPNLYGWFKKKDHSDPAVRDACSCSNDKPCDQFDDCHEEQRAVWGEVFDLASDRDHSLESAHMGVHSQIHIAEDFYREINEL